ncbi:unnamed protein product [Spirodela intermedia]|uniref:Uncharacterized protein n=1 Tax=Spirodela intermedia TaxID=51605 RepID=A0A7I8LGJ7_SPIIN|nr:unnamed protein product [Spirodela intermedia]
MDLERSTSQTENNPMAMKNHYILDSFQKVSNIRVPLAPTIKFEIHLRIFQMLPNFYGLPLEEPHQDLEKFHMVYDLVNLPQVTPKILKMKLFPHTLRDKASHWLSTLDRELTKIEASKEMISTKNKGKNKEDYSENLCNIDIIDECANELYIQGKGLEVCMHHISIEDNVRPIRDVQQRLNPTMLEVIKAEIVK